MKLAELKQQLARQPDATVRFLLPDGNAILPHAHVTEVARIDRRFVDCGGALRNDSLCRLQIGVADDVDYRLTAGRLLKILNQAKSFLVSDDFEVDVEHEIKFISQFPVVSVQVLRFAIILYLGRRRTACLAMGKCLPLPRLAVKINPLELNFREEHLRPGGCCPTKPQTM